MSSFVVQIGFEEISYIVDESAGLVRLVVIVLDGANVFTSGTIERVLVLLTTHTGTALGKRRYFTINFILILIFYLLSSSRRLYIHYRSARI